MFGEDGIEREVASNAPEREVRHCFALESQLLPGGSPFLIQLGNPGSVGVARHVLSVQLAQSVVIELRRQQPMLGQRYAASVNGNPAPPPLLGHIRRRPAATGWRQDQSHCAAPAASGDCTRGVAVELLAPHLGLRVRRAGCSSASLDT